MSTSQKTKSQPPEDAKRPGLPRYYAIVALITVMLMALAGGLIYYRVAVDAMVERVSAENHVFGNRIDGLAEAAINGSRNNDALESEIKAEMAARPVVMVRVYNENRHIRFSTNANDAIGDALPDQLPYWDYVPDMDHVAILDTGAETLRDRDIVITVDDVDGSSYYGEGIAIYSDVTVEHQGIIQTAWIATAAIELLLGIGLAAVMLRR